MVVDDLLFGDKAEILLVLFSNHLENFFELVALRHYVYVSLSTLLHLIARRKREAAIAREQESRVFYLVTAQCALSLDKRLSLLLPVVSLGDEKHLGQNAAKAPEVDGLIVVLLDQNDLRRSVPSGGNMIGEAAPLHRSVASLLDELLG